MELLSPAGDMHCLLSALANGADAVYLGLKSLNARRGAGNFDGEELVRASDLCHERGKKLYVTVNTLMKDSEAGALEALAAEISRAGADGAIVQDLGVAAALREMIPELPLHASTQMALCNRQGMDYLRGAGFSRAVLAREMSFSEIGDCAGRGVELEVFVHGALCVACSGQCLFSSLVGGRSGNRGLCAQPCRLPYRLAGEKTLAEGNLLSPRDLMGLYQLPALQKLGVESLKIEGRLKPPAYVGRVTAVYRRALDAGAAGPADEKALRELFNRGYTPGYGPGLVDGNFLENPAEKHVEKETPYPAAEPARIALTGRLRLRIGERALISLSDGAEEVSLAGAAVERALRAPADPERLAGQILKTGATPYKIASLEREIDEGAFLPLSALNALRRDALDEMSRRRAARFRPRLALRPLKELSPEEAEGAPGAPRIAVESDRAELLAAAAARGADEIIWRPADLTEAGLSRAPEDNFTLAIPPVLPADALNRLNAWALGNPRVAGTLLSNAAQLSLRWPGALRGDWPLNIFNRYAVRSLGLPYVPSVELTAREIGELPGEKELIVYGRMPLMRLRHCPLNAALGGGPHAACARCDQMGPGPKLGGLRLIDRKNAAFPLGRTKTGAGCVITVFNSVPLCLLGKLNRLPPAGRYRLIFTDEAEADALSVLEAFLSRAAAEGAAPAAAPAWTAGHYFRGVD